MKTMDIIYIVEEGEMLISDEDFIKTLNNEAYSPNFVFYGQESNNFKSAESISAVEIAKPLGTRTLELLKQGITSGLVVAAAKQFSPPAISLLIAAASASPIIYQAISGEKSKSSDYIKENESKAIDKFFLRHAITPSLAIRLEYEFPPGHPQIGQSYKIHPLAKLSGSEKAKVYIPQDSYDETLLREREAELIRLLVELGATKISILEKNRVTLNAITSAGATVEHKILGKAGGEGCSSSESTVDDLDLREFELAGRPWVGGDRIDRSQFGWLAFEPSWGAVVAARELGQCTKAAIEIREETTFASEKRFSAELKAKIGGLAGSGSYLAEQMQGRNYLIKAEFASFTNNPVTQERAA